MLRALSLIFLFLTTSLAYANCNFKTGQYIEQLQDPSSIQKIKINVPKSAKYAKNLIKIFASRGENIHPDLKKKFKAEFTVNYSFGTCIFEGILRQAGDWKDHIGLLSGGRPYRSLNVKLDRGNVVSAVQFKLLIPQTRFGENEILTTLILKRLGIISPETFAVEVDVNGISTPMLFQENASKELLEKNYRREGPIFEGDEDILWSFENFGIGELVKFSLSKMSNDSWFEKGESSRDITLSSYEILQSAYSDFATNIKERKNYIIHPNENDRSKFSEYMFALLAMNGEHAFLPSNRRFYFNSITSKFEPIYYDGNTQFKEMNVGVLDLLLSQLDAAVDQSFVDNIAYLLSSKELKSDFIKRAEPLNKLQDQKVNFDKFYDNAIAQYLSNVQVLSNKISQTSVRGGSFIPNQSSNSNYLESLKNAKFSQNIIRKLIKTDSGYKAIFQSGLERDLSIKEVARLIKKNNLNGERTVFLGDYVGNREPIGPITRKVDFTNNLTASAGIKLSISKAEKTITFTQTKKDDWVLIQSGDLNGWDISFAGIKKAIDPELSTDQRFNKYGLTGCLTFYNSKFQNTKIKVVGGVCEDSVNIINSTGSIDAISVTDSFADALDIDFSTIRMAQVNMINSGNDCFDVSGGNYKIGLIELINCEDKGISVGEESTLFVEEMLLRSASIGVASKDLSQATILNAKFENVATCIEVKQKKQEFGGATLRVGNFECDGIVEVDKHSELKAELQ